MRPHRLTNRCAFLSTEALFACVYACAVQPARSEAATALTCCAVVATITCERKPAISLRPSKKDVRRLQRPAGDAERSACAQAQGKGWEGKQTWTRNWRKRLSEWSRRKRRASVYTTSRCGCCAAASTAR